MAIIKNGKKQKRKEKFSQCGRLNIFHFWRLILPPRCTLYQLFPIHFAFVRSRTSAGRAAIIRQHSIEMFNIFAINNRCSALESDTVPRSIVRSSRLASRNQVICKLFSRRRMSWARVFYLSAPPLPLLAKGWKTNYAVGRISFTWPPCLSRVNISQT